MDIVEQQNKLAEAHAHSSVNTHVAILFARLQINGVNILEAFEKCAMRTETPLALWKIFTRIQRAYNLALYFDYTSTLPGRRIECGVFRGLSSLLLMEISRARDANYKGENFHMLDSYEGLSEPTEPDSISNDSTPNALKYSQGKGYFSTPLERVKSNFNDFPEIEFNKGWIPEVLSELPDSEWSFVHIDVDLYEPTKECLNYFINRIPKGGVIINDDYGSFLFPGAKTAWDEFFEEKKLHFIALDSGQAIYMRD